MRKADLFATVDVFYRDTSRSMAETKAVLEELIEHIQSKIDAINETADD